MYTSSVFEVGPNVYVRALTVEPARAALWVGTSAGVHEIDLATQKPRQTFTRKDGLANEYVFAVGIDRDGYNLFALGPTGFCKHRVVRQFLDRNVIPIEAMAQFDAALASAMRGWPRSIGRPGIPRCPSWWGTPPLRT